MADPLAAMAANSSNPGAPESVMRLLQTLNSAVVYSDPSNFATNQKLWNQYAKDWGKDVDWVQKMVGHLQVDQTPAQYLEHLGDEWSTKDALKQVLEEYIYPNLSTESLVAELGSGGGRVSTKVAPKVKDLACFDISEEMLKLARKSLEGTINVSFELLKDPKFPEKYSNHFDFVYAFDVFPHVDLHTQWRYYNEFKRILKPGRRALIHTSNIEAPEGWARFSRQDKYTVGGFYFMSPSIVNKLIAEAGFKIISHSTPTPSNMYYNRDYLVIVEKPL